MQKILTKQEINILKNSEVTKKHPNIIKFLKDNPNLYIEQLNNLNNDEQDFIRNSLDKVIREARLKWEILLRAVDYSIVKDISCNLCNHKMRNSIIIYNKFNNKILAIGLSCAKSFDFAADGRIKKKLNEKKVKRRYENILKLYPQAEWQTDEIYVLLNNYKLNNREEILKEYKILNNKINEAIEIYIDYKTIEKKAEELICEIEIIMNIREMMLEQIKKSINSYCEGDLHKRESA